MLEVIFEKVHKDAIMPTKGTIGSACWDVYSVEDTSVMCGNITIVDLGFKVKIPDGYEIVVRPRSGLAFKYGITIINSPGTVDADYRGPMKVALTSLNDEHLFGQYKQGEVWFDFDRRFKINKGDRIAQIALKKLETYEFIEGKVDDETERGQGGFGSTGH